MIRKTGTDGQYLFLQNVKKLQETNNKLTLKKLLTDSTVIMGGKSK